MTSLSSIDYPFTAVELQNGSSHSNTFWAYDVFYDNFLDTSRC